MRLPKSFIVFANSESVAPYTVASVLSTLLGKEITVLENRSEGLPFKLPKKSILILAQKEISKLAWLRLHGFSGAALILSTESFDLLKRRHRILRWQQGSHNTHDCSETLPSLLTKVAKLVPIERGNLRDLRSELKTAMKARDQVFGRQVIAGIERLHIRTADFRREIDAIETAALRLFAGTPDACHVRITIMGRELQISEHFHTLVDEIRNSLSPGGEQIAALKEVFEQWRDLVERTAEGLDEILKRE